MKEVWVIQHPASRYGVIQSMSEEIARGLAAIPYEIQSKLFERGSPEYLQALHRIAQEDVSVVARIVVNQTIPDDLVYELYGVPHISYLLDAVTHSPELLVQNPFRRSIAAFVDKDSVEMYERLSGMKGLWIPHAVDVDRIRERVSAAGLWGLSHKNRDVDLLISASWIDFQEELSYWMEALSSESQLKLQKIAEEVLESSGQNHLPLLSILFASDDRFRKEVEEAFSGDLWAAYTSLEKYIRGMDRARFVSIAANFPGRIVLLTNSGSVEQWQRAFGSNPNITIQKDVSYEDTWCWYAQSKLVVNSVPTIKKGVHERFLAAIFCGAKVLSTPNEAAAGEPLLRGRYFDMRRLSPQELVAIVQADPGSENLAQAWVERQHSWKARLTQVWPDVEACLEEIRRLRAP